MTEQIKISKEQIEKIFGSDCYLYDFGPSTISINNKSISIIRFDIEIVCASYIGYGIIELMTLFQTDDISFTYTGRRSGLLKTSDSPPFKRHKFYNYTIIIKNSPFNVSW